jgi:hypothetical protein
MESESLGEEIYSPEGKEVVEALIYVGVLVSRDGDRGLLYIYISYILGLSYDVNGKVVFLAIINLQ